MVMIVKGVMEVGGCCRGDSLVCLFVVVVVVSLKVVVEKVRGGLNVEVFLLWLWR